MKYLAILIPLLFLSCIYDYQDYQVDDYENCKFGNHYIKIPITISPHKLTYSVGDTIKISTVFSDSIYDIRRDKTYKIEGFPFEPLSLLFRFYDGMNWDAGYRVNDLYIDSIYNPQYTYLSLYDDKYKAYTIYEDETYRFESELILKEKGRYIMVFTDMYCERNGAGNSFLNAKADSISFEGKCEVANYFPCSVIEGDDHLDEFEEELVFLDNNVYRGKLTPVATNSGPLKAGGIFLEWTGFFGFIVE